MRELQQTPQGNSGDSVALRSNGLTKKYGAKLALDHFSIEVKKGSIFGFLGPNGAGKTTFIRLALSLITPTEGYVEIFGSRVSNTDSQALSRIGAIIEQPALYNYMSGANNLRAFAMMLGGNDEANIQHVLRIVGLHGRQKDRVKTYSLGMKQRLAIAIALLNNPDILMLDEPANGLDPAGVVEIRLLMQNLAAAGKTIFISSHILSEIQQLCNEIAIINQGKLIKQSTVHELTKMQVSIFIVTTDKAATALQFIQAEPWGADAYIDLQNRLITRAPGDKGSDLSAFLAKHEIYPESVQLQEQSLEQVFLQLTQSPQQGVL